MRNQNALSISIPHSQNNPKKNLVYITPAAITDLNGALICAARHIDIDVFNENGRQ